MDVTDPEAGHGAPRTGGDWAGRLRAYRRTRLGLSRADFAELVNAQARRLGINAACSERHIARWELGEVRRPNKTYRDLLAAVGAPDPDAEILAPSVRSEPAPMSCATDAAPGTDVREADPTFLEALASAVVGSPDVLIPWLPTLGEPAPETPFAGPEPDHHFVRDATARLREIDQRHGGSAVADAATNLLKLATTLLARYRGEAREHAMLIAAADLARLLGWACHDVGDQHRARRYATMALLFARRAGADSLVASTLYVLGRISLIEHDPRTALRMFQLGQLPAQDAANGGESARLYANEAWAHAMMGDASRMQFALARAEDEITRVGDLVDPWTRVFFSPGEFTGMQSVIYNEYALTASGRAAEEYTVKAVASARESLAAYAPGRPARSILFDNITIATGAFRLRQIDEAMTFANASLRLTSEVDSGRVADRLGRMAHVATLTSPRSDVRDICQDIRQVLDTAPHRARSPIEPRLASA
ncbi:helix-turn-helix domain-containing protein [Nocardia acidivorans]|uniref:helix-turn-helix domain-containing protein n=1 Tax=Nocardia acidivorans TaxID=404580 RepID=UPI0008355059|nr:transcriptional regulator [Nocardia acidivorans]